MYLIVDIDGTLARRADRSPYDMTQVENDLPSTEVIDVVRKYYEAGYRIHLMTGRTEDGRDGTVKWLEKHNVPHHSLRMRVEGDKQKDVGVKALLYEVLFSEEGERPFFVLEDKDEVVAFWRGIGVTCFQVAEWKQFKGL